MPKNDTDDGRVERAVGLLLSNVTLKVPEAMRAARFLGTQSDNEALHQRVRRLHKKKLSQRNNEGTPPRQRLISLSSSDTDTSYLTAESPMSHPPPVAKGIRRTTSQTQQHRVNKKAKSLHDRLAFKRATTRYAQEKEKRQGKSAQQVCDETEGDYGVTFGARTIQEYVK